MAGVQRPVVDNWYRDRAQDLWFTVVAVDDEARTVELQHFDGDLEEIELAEWYQRELVAAEAPEDWTGPLDNVSPDEWDEEVDADALRPQGPLDELEAS